MPHKKGLWEIEARGLFSDFYSNLQKIIRRQGDQKVNKGIKQKIYICLNFFFSFFPFDYFFTFQGYSLIQTFSWISAEHSGLYYCFLLIFRWNVICISSVKRSFKGPLFLNTWPAPSNSFLLLSNSSRYQSIKINRLLKKAVMVSWSWKFTKALKCKTCTFYQQFSL